MWNWYWNADWRWQCWRGGYFKIWFWLRLIYSERSTKWCINRMLLWVWSKRKCFNIFLECDLNMEIWCKILSWLNVFRVLHNSALSNFHWFEGLCGTGTVSTKNIYICVIWFPCIWVMLKGCNKNINRKK